MNSLPIQDPCFHRVALVGKYIDPAADGPAHEQTKASLGHTVAEIAQFLVSLGCDLYLEKHTAELIGESPLPALDLPGIGAMCDLCIVAGGDGTMLGVARQLARFGTPLVGINLGRLGFITDISLQEYRNALPAILLGRFDEDMRGLITAEVRRNAASAFDCTAMNDVVVHRGASTGMMEVRVEVDGRFVANHRADGIIASTPTGSTAYSLSVGGPLLHPGVPAWLLAPISPHALSNRPIVLPGQCEIAIEIIVCDKASVSFDSVLYAPLRPADRIMMRRSPHRTRFLHPHGWNYFDMLRHKLRWNEEGSNPS